MCVNSSDEEEEFDLDEAPKVVRKKVATENDGAATAEQADSNTAGESGERPTTTA